MRSITPHHRRRFIVPHPTDPADRRADRLTTTERAKHHLLAAAVTLAHEYIGIPFQVDTDGAVSEAYRFWTIASPTNPGFETFVCLKIVHDEAVELTCDLRSKSDGDPITLGPVLTASGLDAEATLGVVTSFLRSAVLS
jgi:hypothetical protein